MPPEIKHLLQTIERQLGWGEPGQWQSRDFDKLNQLILDKTGVSLSASTLKRVWGRVQYESAPSAVTLDALARFAGYEGFRAFAGAAPATALRRPVRWRRLVAALFIVLALGAVAAFAFRRHARPAGDFRFTSRTVVTRGVPNSVVFDYSAPSGDSVFIQQSWDPTRTEPVEPGTHQHTSIYYRPGFFRAKLRVDTFIMCEHNLLIGTDGWLGMVENEPVPMYLKPSEFLLDSLMRLPAPVYAQKVSARQGEPPKTRFFNVGNFDPVPVGRLSFSADVFNEYGEGPGICRFSKVYLITDDGNGAILFPFAMKGCVSDISVFCVDHGASGKNADLSGFGLDSVGWAHLVCRSDGREMSFWVNDRLAYRTPLPAARSNVVGVEFVFVGTGAVRKVRLANQDKTVLQAF
jgi:hypothetical protein